MIGQIKFFNLDTGNGLIQPEIGGPVFIMIEPNSIADYDQLVTGQALEFDLEGLESGHCKAINIQVLMPM